MFEKKQNCFMRRFVFCFMLLLSSSSYIFSYSGPDEPLRIITETDPVIPFVGLHWKISFLVNYPDAGEVSLVPPPLPADYLRLDRITIGGHLMPHGNNAGENWTLIEIFFIPLKSGEIILPSFEIRTPKKNAVTSQMVFRIEAHEDMYVYEAELRWDNMPLELQEGRERELLLVIQNHNPQKPWDESSVVTFDVPQNAIMERISLSSPDLQRNGILRFKIIPLEEGNLRIDPITVAYEDKTLASPPLEIKVIPASAERTQSAALYTLSSEELQYELRDEDAASLRKESSLLDVFPLPLKKQYDALIDRTEELLIRGENVLALAELRKAERDLAAGFALRPYRAELEQRLGLGITADEASLPVKPLLILSAVFFCVSILFFVRLFVNQQPSARSRVRGRAARYVGSVKEIDLGFNTFMNAPEERGIKPSPTNKKKNRPVSFLRILAYILLVIFIVGTFIFGALGLAGIVRRSGKEAPRQVILYDTAFYRVPEESGAVNGNAKEGEPGFIRSSAGEWLYVESGSGQAGWVQDDYVIRY